MSVLGVHLPVVSQVCLDSKPRKHLLGVEVRLAVHGHYSLFGIFNGCRTIPFDDRDKVELIRPEDCSSTRSCKKPGRVLRSSCVFRTLARNLSRACSRTTNLSTR